MNKPSDDMKRCKACGLTKPLDEYTIARTNRDGRAGTCRDCRNARSRAWYEANRERARGVRARWYEEHREEHSRRVLANRDPVKHRAATRRYQQKLKDERGRNRAEALAAYLADIAENGKPCSRCKQVLPLDHFDKDPRYRSGHKSRCKECALLAAREHTRRRRYRMGGAKIDYDAVLARDGMTCHICLHAIESRADLEFDHVIPLSKGGLHVLENVRPAHRSCNRYKAAAFPDERGRPKAASSQSAC